jgi:hypothetical protein
MSPIGHGFREGPHAELDIVGVAAARDDLVGVAERAEDMRPAMVVVRELLKRGNREVFESKGGAIGERWPALKPETVARKAREGIPSLSDILVASGDVEAAAEGGKGSKGSATRSRASAGIALFYARWALTGAAGGRRGREAPRPPIGIPDHIATDSAIAMERYLIYGGF